MLTGQFLNSISEDLYAFFHLIAFRGLRPTKACGLRWEDIDRRERTLCVAVQLRTSDGELTESVPKNEAGLRAVALDAETIFVLRVHRRRQAAARLALGAAWTPFDRPFLTVMLRQTSTHLPSGPHGPGVLEASCGGATPWWARSPVRAAVRGKYAYHETVIGPS